MDERTHTDVECRWRSCTARIMCECGATICVGSALLKTVFSVLWQTHRVHNVCLFFIYSKLRAFFVRAVCVRVVCRCHLYCFYFRCCFSFGSTVLSVLCMSRWFIYCLLDQPIYKSKYFSFVLFLVPTNKYVSALFKIRWQQS